VLVVRALPCRPFPRLRGPPCARLIPPWAARQYVVNSAPPLLGPTRHVDRRVTAHHRRRRRSLPHLVVDQLRDLPSETFTTDIPA